MKQLYIRKGNLDTNRTILIIGEESVLGGRDSAYCTKGTLSTDCLSKDPFTGALGLSYIHACNNILLNTKDYKSDHDVHDFVKRYCKDLVYWDGEANQGLTNSREAFVCKYNVDYTVKKLYERILKQIYPKGIFQRLRAKSKLKKINKKARKRKGRTDEKLLLWLFVAIYLVLIVRNPDFRNWNKEKIISLKEHIVYVYKTTDWSNVFGKN